MSHLNNPIDLINQLSDMHKCMHKLLQDVSFDTLALMKREQLEQKLSRLQFDQVSQIYLGTHLQKAQSVSGNRQYLPLPDDYLTNPGFSLPQGSVLLITNNDVGGQLLSNFIDLYRRHPEVLFVVWDWDSQHWVQMSGILAMHCDFYIPAASENSFLLSHFNPNVIGPIFAGVYQWKRQFLAENFATLLGDRSNEPLGPHAFYGDYERRNRALVTVTKTFSGVGFVDNDYRNKSDLDNLAEWARHKTHWIVPVLAGVPIRVYNALAVGGIPILPAFYRNMPEIALIGESALFYEVKDLIDPRPINEQAVACFDQAGVSGLIERVAKAIDHHHIDRRCEQILEAVERSVIRIAAGDRSYIDGYLGAS
jgi:hypothetical protein